MNNTISEYRNKAEDLAIAALNASTKEEAYAIYDQAWIYSEEAYKLDNNTEPQQHADKLDRIMQSIQRTHGKRVFN